MSLSVNQFGKLCYTETPINTDQSIWSIFHVLNTIKDGSYEDGALFTKNTSFEWESPTQLNIHCSLSQTDIKHILDLTYDTIHQSYIMSLTQNWLEQKSLQWDSAIEELNKQNIISMIQHIVAKQAA